jgi:hypothetical protein
LCPLAHGPTLSGVDDVGQRPGATGGAAALRPGLLVLARWGLVIKGVLQLLVGALALSFVVGGRGRLTDAAGALGTLARGPLGRPVLLIVTTGLFAYAGLRMVEGLLDPRRRPRTAGTVLFRLGDLVSGGSYALLGLGAARLLVGLGAPPSGDARNRRLTAEALALPYGPKILGAFALLLGALAVLFVIRAVVVRDVGGDLVRERMGPAAYRVAGLMIRVSSLVQAMLFGSLAVVFSRAARAHDWREVYGMSGVLHALGAHEGKVILGLVAVGLVIMSGTSFVEARWRKF